MFEDIIIHMRNVLRTDTIWLASLTGRLSVLSFISSVLFIGLYLLGNYQNFLDATLITLLEAVRISNLFQTLCCLFYCITIIISIPYQNGGTLLRILSAIVGMILGILMYSGAAFFLAWVSA